MGQAANEISCCRRDIKSLRDLKPEHLPLLENILKQGTQVGGALVPICKLTCILLLLYSQGFRHLMTSG
jgi:hypothetical protein